MSFVATLQHYLITLSTGTVVARVVASPDAWPVLSDIVWSGILAVMIIEMILGSKPAHVMSARHAAQLTLLLLLLAIIEKRDEDDRQAFADELGVKREDLYSGIPKIELEDVCAAIVKRNASTRNSPPLCFAERRSAAAQSPRT
nr:hypothetical protein [uncultured Cohaesibacter sp.]